MELEKLRIIITGPKVHEVGYRYWLMNQAIGQGIEGFNAYNEVDVNEQQKVVILIEDHHKTLGAYKAIIRENKPERAIVSKIEFEAYPGKVSRLSVFAQSLTAGQLLKAILILQDIQDHVKVLPEIRDYTEQTAESLREDRMARIKSDIRMTKAKLGMA
jgi:acylphosphatase